MGDKIEAKRTALKLGIPCVPGSEGGVEDPDEAKRVAAEIGYPVLVKAAAGGGGRGMKVARTEAELEQALGMARSEAKAAFGDDAVYLEKYLEQARATSRCRCSATAAAARCIWPSATARCSAATRRSGRKAARPPSTRRCGPRSARSAPTR